MIDLPGRLGAPEAEHREKDGQYGENRQIARA